MSDGIDKGMSLKKEEAKVGMNKPEGGLILKKRITSISWIPFKDMPEMYRYRSNHVKS